MPRTGAVYTVRYPHVDDAPDRARVLTDACSNNVDDDCNGLVDSNDPECD